VYQRHRLVAVGASLAVAGIFIAAPARAATATGQQAPQANGRGVTAHSAETASTGTAGATPSGYKSFSSSAKSAGHTTVRPRPALPEQAAAKPAATNSTIIYVVADPNHCISEVGAGTFDDPYCLLQSAVDKAQSGDTIQVWEDSDDDIGYNERVSIVDKSGITIVGEGVGVGDVGPNNNNALYMIDSSDITVQNLVLDGENGSTVDLVGTQGLSPPYTSARTPPASTSRTRRSGPPKAASACRSTRTLRTSWWPRTSSPQS
jgi:hypothetical protein